MTDGGSDSTDDSRRDSTLGHHLDQAARGAGFTRTQDSYRALAINVPSRAERTRRPIGMPIFPAEGLGSVHRESFATLIRNPLPIRLVSLGTVIAGPQLTG